MNAFFTGTPPALAFKHRKSCKFAASIGVVERIDNTSRGTARPKYKVAW
jgi:hypothetical protein